MNEPTIRLEAGPEVSAFVEQVRARLSDLGDEEREELVGGLEADIAELVSDGGSVSELGDPRAYADELRAAAGIERPTGAAATAGAGFLGVRRLRRPVARRVDASLDGARRRWFELVDVPALRTTWDFLTTLRPVWWVLRAWVALQLLDLTTQGGDLATPVPTLGGPLVGSLVWLVAIVVSVQIGRGVIWPGSGAARATFARVVLLALNGFAILMTPVVLGQFPPSGTWEYHDFVGAYEPSPGLMNRGGWVENVFPFDAQGQPLTGVQLFDQDGNPLNVARFAGDEFMGGRRTVMYPWLNGEKRLYNVFPLPRREQDSRWAGVRSDAWTSPNPPYLPTPPLAVVPPAALPGIEIEPTDRTSGGADETVETDEATEAERTEQSGTEATGERSDSEKPAGR